MIALEHIGKTFRHFGKTVTALKDISLDVARGDIYGVVGESGAGKSTLIRCVNLLERPTSGEVIVNGERLTRLSGRKLLQARHNIGMIFQDFNLLSGRTVFANIALPLELLATPRREIRKKVDRLLELTGLSDKSSYYPAQLSGGQKQRVAIARALACDAKILLSDEATSSLDPKTTDAILTLLRELNQTLGVTILLITHEMEVVKKICDKVALLDHGTLVESDTVENFFSAPRSALGKKFIAQIRGVDLPSTYRERLKREGAHPVVRLLFNGGNVNDPLLSTLARQFAIDINIVSARVEQVRTITTGILIAELIGARGETAAALQWLHRQPITTEVLGHV